MNSINLLFAAMILPLSIPLVRADEVDTFVDLLNKGKVEEIKKTTRGIVDPRILKSLNRLAMPIVVVSNDDVQEAVDRFYDDSAAKTTSHGERREAHLKSLRSQQTRLEIAWKQVMEIVKLEGVEVKTAVFRVRRSADPYIGILVFFTSDSEIEMVAALDELAEEVDVEAGQDQDIAVLVLLRRFFENQIKPDDAAAPNK